MSATSFRTVLGAIHATASAKGPGHPGDRALPFLTIARLAGTGGTTLARQLAAALNDQGADPPWEVWDRELVEKTARDENVSHLAVASLEDQPRSWLGDLINGLSFSTPSDETLFRAMAGTMHALAQRGHVILVGRGGVVVTRDLPAGVHLYLIAPLLHRVRHYALEHAIDDEQALKQVQSVDAARDQLHRRLRFGEPLHPEQFHAVLNTARLDEQAMLAIIQPMLKAPALRKI